MNPNFLARMLQPPICYNHVILDAPNNSIGANMGVTSRSEGARNIQFALKYNF